LDPADEAAADCIFGCATGRGWIAGWLFLSIEYFKGIKGKGAK